MKFGFVLPNNWGIASPVDVANVGIEAEALGLDSVFVNHHIVNAGYIADRLGDKPKSVKLGTSVLVMPYLHPMVTAKALATLDQMSGGRVVAGLGVGSLPEENTILQVDYEDRGTSGNEFIEVMQALWADGEANYSGDHFRFDGAVASPKPVNGDIPIWVGGQGAPARRRAGAFGVGWHPMVSVEGLAKRMPKLQAELDANGRTRSDIIVAPRVDVSAIPDAAAVEAWRQAGADQLIASVNSYELADHHAGLSHVAKLQAAFR